MIAFRKPGFVLPVAISLTVLLGLYAGAYYAMVEPTLAFPRGVLVPPDVIPVYRVQANRYLAETGWDSFFRPIHELDRRIRPRAWEPAHYPGIWRDL